MSDRTNDINITRESSWRSGTKSQAANAAQESSAFNAPAPEIARQIADIAILLEGVDQRSARRLEELANAIPSETGRQRWSDVDLRRAFNTDRLSHAYAVKHEGGYAPKTIEIADKLRNVLVLVPILLTWFALGEAVRNYSNFIDANPDESATPFLVLWERGFGSNASFLSPSLSHVAFLDAILILVIILLTFYAHGRREELEDNIADTASLFQAEMDNALAEASVLLASDKSSRPARLADAVERITDSFEQSSNALLNQLQVEHDRMEWLSNRREKEVTDFGLFATGMRSGADEMHRMMITLRDVATNLDRSFTDFGSDLARTADQQKSLLAAVTNLEGLTSRQIQSDQAATRQLSATAARLAEVSEKAIQGAESAANAGRVALDAVKQVAANTQDVSANQQQIDAMLASQQSASHDLGESLRSTDSRAAATARQLADIGNGLAEIQREFAGISQQNSQQLQAISATLQQQTETGRNLNTLVRDIGGVAMDTAQRQREVNDAMQHLVQRLDTLANTLNHLIAQQPGSLRTDGEPGSRWNKNRS